MVLSSVLADVECGSEKFVDDALHVCGEAESEIEERGRCKEGDEDE